LRTLPDGSTVELNFGAEITLDFTPEKRGIRLLRGEALFVVAKNSARPFVVTAGTVEVRAVGTAFAVRHESKHVNVIVTAGRVAVDRVEEMSASGAVSPIKAEPVYLDVGRQVEVPMVFVEMPRLQIREVTTAELAAALAWRDKRIEFADTPLPDAVKLFNRHNRVQLSITNQALFRRSITGVFWTDDPEGFVRLLETGFEISADRSGDAIRLRSK
jgi:transmembrane sensor